MNGILETFGGLRALCIQKSRGSLRRALQTICHINLPTVAILAVIEDTFEVGNFWLSNLASSRENRLLEGPLA